MLHRGSIAHSFPTSDNEGATVGRSGRRFPRLTALRLLETKQRQTDTAPSLVSRSKETLQKQTVVLDLSEMPKLHFDPCGADSYEHTKSVV